MVLLCQATPAAAQGGADGAGGGELRLQRALSGLVYLQAAMAQGRPFPREWQALRPALPQELIPESMQAVLTSHAARGVVPLADLRAQLTGLATALDHEARSALGWLEWLGMLLRQALAPLGLLEPAPPRPVQVALARMDVVLARGQLGAAVADAEALDPPLRSLLEGWLAQARVRLAVEQAVQEAILRALATPLPGATTTPPPGLTP